ncbi:MAG: hypothetical protein IKV59_01335 [Lachnospiraceae bacterium]|nr:hypothetical protein [Lachnospiraceae bacterium]
MKKVTYIISALCLILFLVGCTQKDDDVLHLGFYGRCAIDCNDLIEDEEIIYVNYETHELSVIQFSDLAVGDAVIINAYEKNLNAAVDSSLKVEQIQLATQRLH